MNNETIQLTSDMSLKYLETMIINNSNLYKYEATISEKTYNLYSNNVIDINNTNKNELVELITEKIKLNPSEKDVFIELSTSSASNAENSEAKNNQKQDSSSKKNSNSKANANSSSGKNKKSNDSNSDNFGFILENPQKFVEAYDAISNIDCRFSTALNFFKTFDSSDLPKKYGSIADGVTDVVSKLNSMSGGSGVNAEIEEYKTAYKGIQDGILESIAAQYELALENNKILLDDDSLKVGFSNEDYRNDFLSIIEKCRDTETGYKNLTELFDDLGNINAKYSVTTVEEAKELLNANNLSIANLEGKELTEEEKKQLENLKEQRENIFKALNESLGMSRSEFDSLVSNNIDELAKLISDSSFEIAKNTINGTQSDGNMLNSFFYEMQNEYYSTEAGQQALLDRFLEESSTKFDEYNAIGYTDYIKYCISTGHTYDWLREDLRAVATIVNKIDGNSNFAFKTEVTNESYLASIKESIEKTGVLPYGIKEIDGKYYQTSYTKLGDDMLYYMDYHWGENTGNSGEDKVITAFSNQGYVDAVERNYKGSWIESHSQNENAERDYYVLNGLIKDEERYNELVEQGELSFKQLVDYINAVGQDTNNLLDKNYIESNKEAIMAQTGLKESQLYNFAIDIPEFNTGNAELDAQAAAGTILFSNLGATGIQLVAGLAKFGENIGDAVQMAATSDFMLSFSVDDYGNLLFDINELIDISNSYKELSDKCWESFLATGLYDEQLKAYIESSAGQAAFMELWNKDHYMPEFGTWNVDGEIYWDLPPQSIIEKEYSKYMPYLFKKSKFAEWDLADSSSSNQYLAAFKLGIRDGGDFTYFDNLSEDIVNNAQAQFDTMEKVAVDQIGNWANETFYSQEWYQKMESYSFVKHDNILGMTVNQIGNMAVPVLASMIPVIGPTLSNGLLFTSAFGGAAEEAINSGAGYNEALGYATLSATTELVIELAFSGVQGFGEGWFDDALDFIPNKVISGIDNLISKYTGKVDFLKDNLIVQITKKMITNGIGEGVEEVVTDYITPLWQNWTYLSEKSYDEILSENVSVENEVQTFLVAFLSSMVFGIGNITGPAKSLNNQMNSLTETIGDIPGMRDAANKILAEIIGYGAYSDTGITKLEILNEIIEKNSLELLANNPDAVSAIEKMQQQLKEAQNNLTQTQVVLETDSGEVSVSKALLMDITDALRIDGKYNITDGTLTFKNDKIKNAFIETMYNSATEQLKQLQKIYTLTSNAYEEALNNEEFSINALKSAIETLKQGGDLYFASEILGKVKLEINGEVIEIPQSVVLEVTNKYNLDGENNLTFTDEMTNEEFVNLIYEKAIQKINESKSSIAEQISKFNEAIENKDASALGNAINLVEKTMAKDNVQVIITNSAKVEGQDLVKLEVQTTIDGEQKTVNIYVDSSTNASVYNEGSKVVEKIQEIIEQNKNSENIYIGEITYDKGNDVINTTENADNKAYVENLSNNTVTEQVGTNGNTTVTEDVGTNGNTTVTEDVGTNGNTTVTEDAIIGSSSGTMAVAGADVIEQVTTNTNTATTEKVGTNNNTTVTEAAIIGSASGTMTVAGANVIEQVTTNTNTATTEEVGSNEVVSNEEITEDVSKNIDVKNANPSNIQIDGTLIEIDTLKQMLEPKNLMESLRTGDYQGIKFEHALVELSKIDGINLDPKLQNLVDIAVTLRENQVIFNRSEMYLQTNVEPLILTSDFVNTLNRNQQVILKKISSEQGLIEYLSERTLSRISILENSEILNSNNKYVKQLLELTNGQGRVTFDRVYNPIEVVKNGSNPIIVGNSFSTEGISFNDVNNFIKNGQVSNYYSYIDYVNAAKELISVVESQGGSVVISEKAQNIIDAYENVEVKSNEKIVNISDVAANADVKPVVLPKTINDIDTEQVYKFLTNKNLLMDFANGKITDVNMPQMVSALKTVVMMQEHIGIEIDRSTIRIINNLYNQNIHNVLGVILEDKLPQVYVDYMRALGKTNNNTNAAIIELEHMGYESQDVAKAMLSVAARMSDYNKSRQAYNQAYDYLISKNYTPMQAAEEVGRIYKELIDLRGFDTVITQEGFKIHIQKGINWNNQAYSLEYIENQIKKVKSLYKTDIPVDIYVYDTFNHHDKYWEVKYKRENFKSAATGGNYTINVYENSVVDDTLFSHEYAHLIDAQIMKENGLSGRFAETSEWLNAIAKDTSAPTEYAETNSIEDFAESVAHMRKDPAKFKKQFPNRYKVLSKYISVEEISLTTQNEISVGPQLNSAIDTMIGKFGEREAFNRIIEYLNTGDSLVITRTNNARNIIASVDKNTLIEYINNNYGTNKNAPKIVSNEEVSNDVINSTVTENVGTKDNATVTENVDIPMSANANTENRNGTNLSETQNLGSNFETSTFHNSIQSELSASQRHLIMGDGINDRKGISGAHSVQYFMNLFNKSFDEVKEMYNVGNVSYISLGARTSHESISYVYNQQYYYETRRGVFRSVKTLVDSDEQSLLKWQQEATQNSIQLNGKDARLGMASNGLWFKGFKDGNSFPLVWIQSSDINAMKSDGLFKIKVPVKINGVETSIDVTIDSNSDTNIFNHGPQIIQKVQEIVNTNPSTTETIDLGKIEYNSETGKIENINDGPAPSRPAPITSNDTQTTILKDSNTDLTESESIIEKNVKDIVVDFMQLDVADIAKVLRDNTPYNGYDAKTMLNAVIELYNDAKANNLNISINPNLEHFINEYQSINLEENNVLLNLDNALYNKESIVSVPARITTSSYRSVSIYDLLDIISGNKDISTTRYSEIDLYEAVEKYLPYFEGKNVSISQKIISAFDIVNSMDENSTIINFMDVLNGNEKIVLPKKIKGKYGESNISDVISYLNGKTSFISTGVIDSLKEYIDLNNVNVSSEMMDKINLLSGLGENEILLNEKEYLSGKNNPIIVPKILDGVYTNTSSIYGWITGKEKLYDTRTTEEIISLTTKFTEYIYSNNIVLDDATMAKLEVLKNLKANETILNLQEFFNGSSQIVVNNNISMNGTNLKTSTILDIINLSADTYLKILSGQSIDGINRNNIFDAIEVLYYVNPGLKEATFENYEKIKSIYNNNFVLNGRYVLPKAFNDVSCEFIEMILHQPTLIAQCNSDERAQILNAINEYINYIGENNGKYSAYKERVEMRDNLVDLMSREIPEVNLSEEVHSALYYMFQSNQQLGGTFGTNQGAIAKMLNDLGVKDAFKVLFSDNAITDDKFLEDLKRMDITKEKLSSAIDNLFASSSNIESVSRLMNFISNNEVIKLVRKNFPGMNGVEAIRFLYLVETVEAGNNGVCNYAAAVNMIFDRYIGKEMQFETDFGYPMYVTNEQGNKVLNDKMLLADMYSTINRGVLVKEIDGKYEIATSNGNYLNLSDVGRFKMDYLQKFIEAKGIDLGLKENFYYSSFDHVMWKEELILKVKEALEKGEYINVSGAGFDLLYKDGNTALKDCGGHIMTLVGLTPDGKLIVDSWGKELLIDLESTLAHSGEEVSIDGKKITRRLAIATYELTDISPNIDITNQTNLSNQNLETFDIPRDIDMIDESSINYGSDNASTTVTEEVDRSMGADIKTENRNSTNLSETQNLSSDIAPSRSAPITSNETYTTISKNNHGDLTISRSIVEKYGKEAVDDFIELYDKDYLLSEYIKEMDITSIRKNVDIMNELNIDINSNKTLAKFKQLLEPLDGRHILNLSNYVYSGAEPIRLPQELYEDYSEQINDLYKIVSNSYYTSKFLKNPDLELLQNLKIGLFSDSRLDASIIREIESIKLSMDELLNGKVLLNTNEFVNDKSSQALFVDKALYEKYQTEFDALMKSVEYKNDLRTFLENPNPEDLAKISRLFSSSEVDLDSNEGIKKLHDVMDSLLDGKVVVNARSYLYSDAKAVFVSQEFYQANKSIIDKYISIADSMFEFKNFISSNDINLANEIKKIIDSKEVIIESKYASILNKVIDDMASGNVIVNTNQMIYGNAEPIVIRKDIYDAYVNANPNSEITLSTLYDFITSDNEIYKLLNQEDTFRKYDINKIKESLEYYISIAEQKGYEDLAIREARFLLNSMEDTTSIEELYDIFSIAHTEFNTPEGYYEFVDILKSFDQKDSIANTALKDVQSSDDIKKEAKIDAAIKKLESAGYTNEQISEIILHFAFRGDNIKFKREFYYRAFDYLVEKGMNEKEASKVIYSQYETIMNRRGTRVIGTTSSGIKISVVNNLSTNNKLLTVENVESILKQAEKYYSKTDLKEIIFYDTFSPRNIYAEKIQYEDYVKIHNNRRFIASASASSTDIILWEDFSRLEDIVHEYGHTIDRHIKVVYKLSSDFSSTPEWVNAINKDRLVTLNRVSSYASATNAEDFAEFLRVFNNNPLNIALKYPNRYKAASKYLNMDIDVSIVQEYINGQPYLFKAIEKMSNLLTEEGSAFEFVKEYVFGDLKDTNSIAKTVITELDSVYETSGEIIEDYGAYDLLNAIKLDEMVDTKKYLSVIKDYLDGKDISSSFSDSRNLELLNMLDKEEVSEWYEEELNEATAEDPYWRENNMTSQENNTSDVHNAPYMGDINPIQSSNEESAISSDIDSATSNDGNDEAYVFPIKDEIKVTSNNVIGKAIGFFKKTNVDLDLFKETLLTGDIRSLSDTEISMLADYIKKGKIKLKNYNLNSDSIGTLLDKVPIQKMYPLSNVKAVKSFIDYFGKDTLVEFDKLNNNFLLGNNGENLYNLFDFYDLSIPRTNESNKLKELDNLITSVINSNKKTDLRTYTFNYSDLIGTEYANMHPELFLDESAPQDLKDAFYNGLVNSGNEYKTEWSKYLEGKSVKGVIHEPLISFEDAKVIENINSIGETSVKYQKELEDLANRVGLTSDEVQEILSTKLDNLIQNSEFGVRRTLKSLESILDSGKIKNQFEVNHSSYGVNNTDMRMDMEKEMFGILRNIKYEDRPIYGMLLPQDLNSKYVQKGPGSYYSEGSGVIYIFDKSKIMNNVTLTLGDSLDQAGKVSATNLSNPKYFGMFNEMLSTIKTKEDLENFDFTSLYEKSVLEVGNSAYYEFQLHGESSHTLDNLKEIVFLKEPEAKVINKLKELNISYRVIK